MKNNFGNAVRFISPKYISIYLLVFSMLLALIPKDIYETNLHEYMLMNNDPNFYLLLILCTSFFVGGVWTVERIRLPVNKSDERIKVNKLTFYFSQVISLIGSITLLIILGRNVGISFLIENSLSDASPSLRYTVFKIMGDANLSWVTPVGYFAIVCGFWYLRVGQPSKTDRVVYLFSLCLSILGAFLQLSKAPIISIIILLFSCHIIVGFYIKSLNIKKLLINSVAILVLVTAIFYVLQTQRYSAVAGSGATQLLGYFPASYNRLAALLEGKLVMPAKDGFYYTNLGLWGFPVIGRVARDAFGAFMGITIPSNGFDIWYRGFEAVNMAGLNRNFIWITTYGEAFQDYGWFAPIWFYIYGVFMGVFWKLLLQSDSIGLFVYPVLILTMQWWSIASIFGRETMIVIFLAIMSKILIGTKLPKLKIGRY